MSEKPPDLKREELIQKFLYYSSDIDMGVEYLKGLRLRARLLSFLFSFMGGDKPTDILEHAIKRLLDEKETVEEIVANARNGVGSNEYLKAQGHSLVRRLREIKDKFNDWKRI